jgi:hypothetical protein
MQVDRTIVPISRSRRRFAPPPSGYPPPHLPGQSRSPPDLRAHRIHIATTKKSSHQPRAHRQLLHLLPGMGRTIPRQRLRLPSLLPPDRQFAAPAGDSEVEQSPNRLQWGILPRHRPLKRRCLRFWPTTRCNRSTIATALFICRRLSTGTGRRGQEPDTSDSGEEDRRLDQLRHPPKSAAPNRAGELQSCRSSRLCLMGFLTVQLERRGQPFYNSEELCVKGFLTHFWA